MSDSKREKVQDGNMETGNPVEKDDSSKNKPENLKEKTKDKSAKPNESENLGKVKDQKELTVISSPINEIRATGKSIAEQTMEASRKAIEEVFKAIEEKPRMVLVFGSDLKWTTAKGGRLWSIKPFETDDPLILEGDTNRIYDTTFNIAKSATKFAQFKVARYKELPKSTILDEMFKEYYTDENTEKYTRTLFRDYCGLLEYFAKWFYLPTTEEVALATETIYHNELIDKLTNNRMLPSHMFHPIFAMALIDRQAASDWETYQGLDPAELYFGEGVKIPGTNSPIGAQQFVYHHPVAAYYQIMAEQYMEAYSYEPYKWVRLYAALAPKTIDVSSATAEQIDQLANLRWAPHAEYGLNVDNITKLFTKNGIEKMIKQALDVISSLQQLTMSEDDMKAFLSDRESTNTPEQVLLRYHYPISIEEYNQVLVHEYIPNSFRIVINEDLPSVDTHEKAFVVLIFIMMEFVLFPVFANGAGAVNLQCLIYQIYSTIANVEYNRYIADVGWTAKNRSPYRWSTDEAYDDDMPTYLNREIRNYKILNLIRMICSSDPLVPVDVEASRRAEIPIYTSGQPGIPWAFRIRTSDIPALPLKDSISIRINGLREILQTLKMQNVQRTSCIALTNTLYNLAEVKALMLHHSTGRIMHTLVRTGLNPFPPTNLSMMNIWPLRIQPDTVSNNAARLLNAPQLTVNRNLFLGLNVFWRISGAITQEETSAPFMPSVKATYVERLADDYIMRMDDGVVTGYVLTAATSLLNLMAMEFPSSDQTDLVEWQAPFIDLSVAVPGIDPAYNDVTALWGQMFYDPYVAGKYSMYECSRVTALSSPTTIKKLVIGLSKIFNSSANELVGGGLVHMSSIDRFRNPTILRAHPRTGTVQDTSDEIKLIDVFLGHQLALTNMLTVDWNSQWHKSAAGVMLTGHRTDLLDPFNLTPDQFPYPTYALNGIVNEGQPDEFPPQIGGVKNKALRYVLIENISVVGVDVTTDAAIIDGYAMVMTGMTTAANIAGNNRTIMTRGVYLCDVADDITDKDDWKLYKPEEAMDKYVIIVVSDVNMVTSTASVFRELISQTSSANNVPGNLTLLCTRSWFTTQDNFSSAPISTTGEDLDYILTNLSFLEYKWPSYSYRAVNIQDFRLTSHVAAYVKVLGSFWMDNNIYGLNWQVPDMSIDYAGGRESVNRQNSNYILPQASTMRADPTVPNVTSVKDGLTEVEGKVISPVNVYYNLNVQFPTKPTLVMSPESRTFA